MTDIRFDNLGPDDYDRAKTVLNRAKHPGFVGRELFYRCATTGVVCVAVIDGVDSGVAMIAKQKLQALSVITSAQGRGVGPALMARLKPQWVLAIGDRIGFFEKLGYKPFGAAKAGQNGKHATQLMQRGDEAISSAEITEARVTSASASAAAADSTANISLRPLLDASVTERAEAELDILEQLLGKCIVSERFESALKVFEAAQRITRSSDRDKRARKIVTRSVHSK